MIVDKPNHIAFNHAMHGASNERLAQFLGSDGQMILDTFRPLRPPDDVLATIVRSRKPGDRPVIGIAWHSINQRKQLPNLQDWACLLRTFDAHYVSLQYDETTYGLHVLSELSGRIIEGANGIDPLADLDRFAAQVASVDAVVSRRSCDY